MYVVLWKSFEKVCHKKCVLLTAKISSKSHSTVTVAVVVVAVVVDFVNTFNPDALAVATVYHQGRTPA